jgi:transposase
VVVEDLNVTGMIANRRLARSVSDQAFGAGRRMLGYKTAREGGTLVVADRFYPSSKGPPGPPPTGRLRHERQQALSRNGWRCGS